MTETSTTSLPPDVLQQLQQQQAVPQQRASLGFNFGRHYRNIYKEAKLLSEYIYYDAKEDKVKHGPGLLHIRGISRQEFMSRLITNISNFNDKESAVLGSMQTWIHSCASQEELNSVLQNLKQTTISILKTAPLEKIEKEKKEKEKEAEKEKEREKEREKEKEKAAKAALKAEKKASGGGSSGGTVKAITNFLFGPDEASSSKPAATPLSPTASRAALPATSSTVGGADPAASSSSTSTFGRRESDYGLGAYGSVEEKVDAMFASMLSVFQGIPIESTPLATAQSSAIEKLLGGQELDHDDAMDIAARAWPTNRTSMGPIHSLNNYHLSQSVPTSARGVGAGMVSSGSMYYGTSTCPATPGGSNRPPAHINQPMTPSRSGYSQQQQTPSRAPHSPPSGPALYGGVPGSAGRAAQLQTPPSARTAYPPQRYSPMPGPFPTSSTGGGQNPYSHFTTSTPPSSSARPSMGDNQYGRSVPFPVFSPNSGSNNNMMASPTGSARPFGMSNRSNNSAGGGWEPVSAVTGAQKTNGGGSMPPRSVSASSLSGGLPPQRSPSTGNLSSMGGGGRGGSMTPKRSTSSPNMMVGRSRSANGAPKSPSNRLLDF